MRTNCRTGIVFSIFAETGKIQSVHIFGIATRYRVTADLMFFELRSLHPCKR